MPVFRPRVKDEAGERNSRPDEVGLRFDEAEELNGGDVVALVGDTDGVQKVSRSARGSDRAEWRVVSTNPQILGNDIYDEDAAVPIALVEQ